MTLIRLPAGLWHGTAERERGRKEGRRGEETEAERAAVTDKEDVAGAKD